MDLFASQVSLLAARAIQRPRELGAYEALWARPGTTFKSIARLFAEHPGAIPSDFVPEQESERHSRLALETVRAAGIEHFGIRVNGAGDFPNKLRAAAHPVELLYFQGKWEFSATPSVAIVGTRCPSDDGKRRAARLAREFARAGYTVVSGLAAGIDTVAHEWAMEAGGRTIAVLGTPISATYPDENRQLQQRIADQHLVISQVPVLRYAQQSAHWNRLFFPERNVTMSALTDATIIVEAGNTSGTLIQARHAVSQGRAVFILDSCFSNPELTWPAKFLDQGAIRVTELEEILEHLASRSLHSDCRPDASCALLA